MDKNLYFHGEGVEETVFEINIKVPVELVWGMQVASISPEADGG